jgi:hypothetical protein
MDMSKIGFSGKKFFRSLCYETFSILYVLNGTACTVRFGFCCG